MGRKIPPANDGSNYYQARKGNRIEGVSFEAALFDEIMEWPSEPPSSVKGHHVDLSAVVGSGQWGFISQTSNSSYTIPAYTTVPNVNMITMSSNTMWTLESDLTPEELGHLQEQIAVIPDHEWNPNAYGQCADCPYHNMYRRDPNSHLFVIQEPPSRQDWLDQLAS